MSQDKDWVLDSAKYEHMWLVASSADIYSNESQEEIL